MGRNFFKVWKPLVLKYCHMVLQKYSMHNCTCKIRLTLCARQTANIITLALTVRNDLELGYLHTSPHIVIDV